MHIIPDFLANANVVTVSYFEMVQNIIRYCWSFEEVHQKLDERMTMAYQGVLAAVTISTISTCSTAAYTVAVARATDHLDCSYFQ